MRVCSVRHGQLSQCIRILDLFIMRTLLYLLLHGSLTEIFPILGRVGWLDDLRMINCNENNSKEPAVAYFK